MVPSPTGAYLPLGPVPGRRQASSAAVVEEAANASSKAADALTPTA